MLTAFGKAVRKLRVDRNLLLKTMAADLNVTSSYLSGLEHGKKHIPENFIKRIRDIYGLNDEEVQALIKAKEMTVLNINIELANKTPAQIKLASVFAKKLNSLSENQIERVFEAIGE